MLPALKSGMNVNFSSPANAGVLHHLEARAAAQGAVLVARATRSQSPASVDDPYCRLGTHPDLVSWFWDELTAKLPESCKWIVWGSPVLVHPASGIVFGFAGGTHTYALRLPPTEREAAQRAGAKRIWHYPAYPELSISASTLDLADVGEEWVFGQFHRREQDWCLAAYEFAGRS